MHATLVVMLLQRAVGCRHRQGLILQGSEAHDQLLGRVFGYAAAIRAGHVKDTQLAARCATALIGSKHVAGAHR